MDVFMEKGLCLERTKMGSNDKDHAYVVSRNQGTCIAGSIFIGFLVCAAAIIEFKAEMLTSVGWSSTMTVESVLVGIRANMLVGGARLDLRIKQDYSEAEAQEAFNRMVREHGWY